MAVGLGFEERVALRAEIDRRRRAELASRPEVDGRQLPGPKTERSDVEVAEAIEELLRDGQARTAWALGAETGASRKQVRRALALLIEDGVVDELHGRGRGDSGFRRRG